MSGKIKDLITLFILIISFFIFSFNILYMYSVPSDTYVSKVNVQAGIVFWLTLIVCIASIIKLHVSQAKWCRKNGIEKKKGRKPAVFCFFSNRYAVVSDVALAISIVVFVYALWKGQGSGQTKAMNYFATANIIFTFCMHCLLNSQVFYFTINQDKILRKLNRRRVRISKNINFENMTHKM